MESLGLYADPAMLLGRPTGLCRHRQGAQRRDPGVSEGSSMGVACARLAESEFKCR